MHPKRCLVGTIRLSDHPTRPDLQVGVVCGFTVVVGRHYADGVRGVFLPEGAIIPDGLAEEMWVKGSLAGKKKNRVKARDMHGVRSEGLFYGSRFHLGDPGGAGFVECVGLSFRKEWHDGQDVSIQLGVRFAEAPEA